mmetsp:Transcript_13672/g.27826  ORF Transcript_13672/g.27826 Transcript_13672/m.27826 type:complete len:211 (+) Transcript_13672:178-810(+)
MYLLYHSAQLVLRQNLRLDHRRSNQHIHRQSLRLDLRRSIQLIHPPNNRQSLRRSIQPIHPQNIQLSALLVIGATGVVGVNALQFVTALRLERENVFVVHSHVLYGVTGTEKKTLLAMNLTGEYDSKVKRPYVVGGVDVGCTHQVMKLQPTMHITLISSNVETDFSSSKVQIDASNLQEYLPVTKANVRSGKYTALVTIGKSEISVTIAA